MQEELRKSTEEEREEGAREGGIVTGRETLSLFGQHSRNIHSFPRHM